MAHRLVKLHRHRWRHATIIATVVLFIAIGITFASNENHLIRRFFPQNINRDIFNVCTFTFVPEIYIFTQTQTLCSTFDFKTILHNAAWCMKQIYYRESHLSFSVSPIVDARRKGNLLIVCFTSHSQSQTSFFVCVVSLSCPLFASLPFVVRCVCVLCVLCIYLLKQKFLQGIKSSVTWYGDMRLNLSLLYSRFSLQFVHIPLRNSVYIVVAASWWLPAPTYFTFVLNSFYPFYYYFIHESAMVRNVGSHTNESMCKRASECVCVSVPGSRQWHCCFVSMVRVCRFISGSSVGVCVSW